MPIWDRPTIWDLVRHNKARLDSIILEVDSGVFSTIGDGIERLPSGNSKALNPLKEFTELCVSGWEQFSATGRIFEDVVREWFLPTALGQLGSGEDDTFRELPARSPKRG